MNQFIGGSQHGQDFPFDPDEYAGNTFKVANVETSESEIYQKFLVGEHTFWVVESIPRDTSNYIIKKILDNP